MDLSVLGGTDPAGYKAEGRIKEAKRKLEDPFSGRSKKPKNPGNAYVTQVVNYSSGRWGRQRDIDRLDHASKMKRKEAEEEEYRSKREDTKKSLEDKTAKRRERRKQKKTKQQASKQKVEPQ